MSPGRSTSTGAFVTASPAAGSHLAPRGEISLDGDPEAREMLGDETWELVRKDHRHRRSRETVARSPVDELDRVVDSLERV